MSKPSVSQSPASSSASGFLHQDWTTIPVEHVAEGIDRQMIWGERLMVCRVRFAAGTITPVHTHVHEQITIVERGRAAFTIDGETRVASTGDVLLFPSQCPHGATMLEEEVVLIDIFSPVREDFLPKPDPDPLSR
jgi:quercetin dioxygenase-like cupin family protein